MSQVLLIGNALVDWVNEVDHYPFEDEELRVLKYSRRVGGNAANTAQVLQQLGHECTWLGTLADDNEGVWLKSTLQKQGIAMDYAPVLANTHTPHSTIILNQSNGSRTILHQRQLPELQTEHLNTLLLSEYDWFHLEGRNVDLLPEFLKTIQRSRIDQPISLEIEKNRHGLEVLMAEVDVVFMSGAYFKAKYLSQNPYAVLRELSTRYPKTIITITLGAEGALVVDAQGQIHYAPAQVVEVLDTVGAGDVFNAAMISALASGLTPQEALYFAVQLAQHKVQQYGLDNLIKRY